eukprot:g22880.t1
MNTVQKLKHLNGVIKNNVKELRNKKKIEDLDQIVVQMKRNPRKAWMSDNEPEEERHDDPEQEEPENEGAMALLEAQQEAQDARDARVLQTDEKKAPDQTVAGITDGVTGFD